MIDRGPEDEKRKTPKKPVLKPSIVRSIEPLTLLSLKMKPQAMHRQLVQTGIMPVDASRIVAEAYGVATELDGSPIAWKWQEISKLLFLRFRFAGKIDVSQDRFTVVEVKP